MKAGQELDSGRMHDFESVPIDAVRDFWNKRPCNIRHSTKVVGSREYFDEVDARKYFVEPHIPAFADFPRWRGRRVIEIGCGIGTATVSFLRAGAFVTAVDLSDESLQLARRHAEVYGLADNARFVEADVERLSEVVAPEPYDLVYSFGVLHHTPHPERAIEQIRSFVRPGSTLKLMMYHSHSWKVFSAVLRSGGRFWDWRRIIARYSEAQTGCPVTYTYTKRELRAILEAHGFRVTEMSVDHIFPYRIPDYIEYHYRKVWYFRWMPQRLFHWLERHFGWHLCVTAVAENVPPRPITLADHPVFRHFDQYGCEPAPGIDLNFLGQKTNPVFGFASTAQTSDYFPRVSEESFEWIAVLEAVLEARKEFTMIELGAGYGRWLVTGVCAARKKRPDLAFRLVAVEPEPTHFRYLCQHFLDNDLNPKDHELVEAAVNASGRRVHFMVGHSNEWYGQDIVPEGFVRSDYPTARSIEVAAVKLVDLLASHSYVDLIDADVQGAELEVVAASIDTMTRKVRRAYVSTHSADIHSKVAQTFEKAGWTLVEMHGWSGEQEETQFGRISFVDGIQYWLNPHVAPRDGAA